MLPRGTTYPMDQVDYRHSPRGNGKVNQKLEKSPKQNRSKKSEKYSPEKQSYDKVEVRILKRPTDDKSMYEWMQALLVLFKALLR